MTARLVADDDVGRADAIAVLRGGGLVALPTDTVYGIGVSLDADRGIERLFEAKNRPLDKAIVLLLADAEQATTIATFGAAARVLAAAGWPGGLTLVLPQKPGAGLPAILTAGTTTIGLRVPAHATPQALAAAVGPLPVTSANLSGHPAAIAAAAIAADFGETVDLILDGGPARGGHASTVIDCTGERPRLLRDGLIPAAALAAVLDEAELPHDLPRD